MRNGIANRTNHKHKVKVNTERSEQKVQGHAPGQGQGVKPIVGKALSEFEAEPQ